MKTTSSPIPLALIAASLLFTLPTARADVVTFPDANLEAAVRVALNKPAGPITTADMLTVTSLNAENRGIRNTTGLETALNLTNLVFNNNPVTNYSGISGLITAAFGITCAP